MQETLERENRGRIAPRNPTETAITCRPYASNGTLRTSDGIMRNFSRQGAYIETYRIYKPGTILILRTVQSSPMPSSMADDWLPPSLCLAEVKWVQELINESSTRLGMGLRYIV